jgi:hypothetical protein
MARTVQAAARPLDTRWVPYAPADVTRALRTGGYHDPGSTDNPPRYQRWTEQGGRYGTLLAQSCPAALDAAEAILRAGGLPPVDDAAVAAALAERERRRRLTWDQLAAEDAERLALRLAEG